MCIDPEPVVAKIVPQETRLCLVYAENPIMSPECFISVTVCWSDVLLRHDGLLLSLL